MGPTNPDLTSALDNLAVALAAQEKFTDSEPIYRRALALREKATVDNLNDLAMAMQGAGELPGAEKHFVTAITLAEKIPPLPGEKSVGEKDVLAKTLQNYSALLHEMKRDDDAAKVEARMKALGKTNPQ